MKKIKKYTRSTKLSLKFLNDSKKQQLLKVLDEYKILTQKFVDYFWLQREKDLPKFCGSDTYNMFETFLGGYIRQCAGKQALGIVRGTIQKQKQRLYVYNKLLEEKNYKKARKLKQKIDSVNMSCPAVDNIEMEVGGNLPVLRFEEPKKLGDFDLWLYVSFSKNFLNKTYLPLKRTKHYNKLLKEGGKRAAGCRISKDYVCATFSFEKEVKEEGETIGIDIGSKNVISCSNGLQTSMGLDDIQKKITRKKKGSKAYRRALEERKNFINRSINLLNLSNVRTIKRENIKNLKKGVRTSRFLTAWTYTEIFDKLDRYAEEQNVSVVKISPTYTSQRCSVCGWTRKSNRKGKEFRCTSCGHTEDADLNASKNIALNLRAIGKQERLSQKNRTGFYWNGVGKEFIASSVKGNKT